tara:strand:- start:37601 stop:38887 length:1287 start_codon:yes stop_codon:yes gene_type:complete
MNKKIVISTPSDIKKIDGSQTADKAKIDVPKIDERVGQLADSLIATAPCASSNWSEDNPHHMGYGLKSEGGWMRFMQGHIWRCVNELGYKRVLFHLPCGKTTGQSPWAVEQRRLEAEYGIPYNDWTHEQKEAFENLGLEKWHMSIDHAHDLERTGNEFIMYGFYEALDWVHEQAPDVEIICYIGSYDGEDKRRIENNEYGEVFYDWWRSIKPLIDREWVSLVFDAAVGKEPDHPNARLVQLAQDAKKRQGRFVGVEARIQKGRPWPNDMGMTCVAWAKTWRRQAHSGNIPRSELNVSPIIVYDGHARSQVENDYNGDWFAYMAENLMEDCQLAPSPLGGEFAELTTTQVAQKLLTYLPDDSNNSDDSEVAVEMTVVDASGQVEGPVVPKAGVMMLWTPVTDSPGLDEETKTEIRKQTALAIYNAISKR